MKKVGIITFHNAHNFGAVLQCLALKTVIRNMGHEVQVVNYENPSITNAYKNSFSIDSETGFFRILKSFVRYCLTFIPKKNRIRKFKNFIKHYILDNINANQDNCFDCMIFGSDQIWRWDLTGDDTFYWGKTNYQCKTKISYAASAGNFDNHIDKNIPFLKDFSFISVREKELQEFLMKRGINAAVTIDPTLLLDKNQWANLLSLKQNVHKPYILLYAMRDKEKVRKTANHIAMKESLNLVEIYNNEISHKDILKKYNDGNPIDFLTLIYNAKYIITDSFHGTVFSILFNKQFVTLNLNDGNDNRAQSLLNELGLEERMSETGEQYYKPIDYTTVNSKLVKLRLKSMEFLEGALATDRPR